MSLLFQTVHLVANTFTKTRLSGLGNLLALIKQRKVVKQYKKTLPRSERKASRGSCIPVNREEFIRPDPLLYAQYYLMSLGLAVTWNNPDIQIFKGTQEITDPLLLPATTYTVRARIWNASLTCPVLKMKVHFSYMDFGIGGILMPVGTVETDLGVKGGSNHPAFVEIPWTTPPTAGHYCLQVEVTPPDDSNWLNNLGQRNFDVAYTQSPANFTFRLRNNSTRRQQYTFETDTYQLVAPPQCEPLLPRRPNQIAAISRREKARSLDAHQRGFHQLPSGWQVDFSTRQPQLEPGETQTILVAITPPAGFKGQLPVNVNAFYNTRLPAGGVTLLVVAQ